MSQPDRTAGIVLELNRARKRLARIWELHREVVIAGVHVCKECGYAWPCLTSMALTDDLTFETEA